MDVSAWAIDGNKLVCFALSEAKAAGFGVAVSSSETPRYHRMNFSTFLVDRDAVKNRGVLVRTSVGAAAEPTKEFTVAELG